MSDIAYGLLMFTMGAIIGHFIRILILSMEQDDEE